MTAKLKKEEGARDPFRPKYVVDDVARITKDDATYAYKLVIYNYKHLPMNVPLHEARGYEIVYSTEHIEDDRKFSANRGKDEEALRPRPVTQSTNDGYDQVLMRIPKELEKTNAKNNALKRAADHKRANKKRKVSREANTVSINDGEIDFNNPNEDNLNE